jgi:hypothetical protein
MKTFVTLLTILMLLAFTSCEKQNSGTATVSLDFKAINGTVELKSDSKGDPIEGLEIDSAIIILEKIELKLQGTDEDDDLEGEDDADDDNEFLYTGPYVIDLLSQTSEPDLPLADFKAGIYTKLEAELYVDEERGHSVYISGTFTTNDIDPKDLKFVFTYSQTEDFKAENPDGFEVNEDMINNIWVLLDLGSLFAGVDFSEANIDEDDIIRINKESNNDIADIIESNLENATEIDDDDFNDDDEED